jgi:hypothetical protein
MAFLKGNSSKNFFEIVQQEIFSKADQIQITFRTQNSKRKKDKNDDEIRRRKLHGVLLKFI